MYCGLELDFHSYFLLFYMPQQAHENSYMYFRKSGNFCAINISCTNILVVVVVVVVLLVVVVEVVVLMRCFTIVEEA